MTTLSLNNIKQLRALSNKKEREEQGLFIIEGEKVVNEAIESGFEIVEIFRTSDIGEEVMKKITCFSSPSPVLAVVKERQYTLSELFQTDGKLKQDYLTIGNPLFLGLCGVRDPGNLGTIIRIADWFGIDAIFSSEDTVELYNPKTVQATMGAIFRKKVIYCNMEDLIGLLKKNELPVYGTFLNGKNIYSVKPEKKGLIIMGNESNGIPQYIENMINKDCKLFLPPYPSDTWGSESLNVAVSTAIVCAEFRRGL